MQWLVTNDEKSYAYSPFENREWGNTFCGHQYVNHAHIRGSHLSTHAQRVTLCVYIRQLQIDARTQ